MAILKTLPALVKVIDSSSLSTSTVVKNRKNEILPAAEIITTVLHNRLEVASHCRNVFEFDISVALLGKLLGRSKDPASFLFVIKRVLLDKKLLSVKVSMAATYANALLARNVYRFHRALSVDSTLKHDAYSKMASFVKTRIYDSVSLRATARLLNGEPTVKWEFYKRCGVLRR